MRNICALETCSTRIGHYIRWNGVATIDGISPVDGQGRRDIQVTFKDAVLTCELFITYVNQSLFIRVSKQDYTTSTSHARVQAYNISLRACPHCKPIYISLQQSKVSTHTVITGTTCMVILNHIN